MADYEFPEVPALEKAFRDAYRALQGLAMPDTYVSEDDAPRVWELISQFPSMVDRADRAVAAQLGPPVSWQAPREEGSWELVVSGVDLDNDAFGFGDLELDDSAFEGPEGRWHGSALDRAARAYSREARWDFAPGESGIWLLMLAPVSAVGGDEGPWGYSGHLTGFVILHDRDEDGVYESVAHIWTAAAWRRRGIARRLLAEAKQRFTYTGVERPYTADGAALLEATADPTATDGDATESARAKSGRRHTGSVTSMVRRSAW